MSDGVFPTAWSAKDKCSVLSLSRDGMTVTYTGSGKSDSDAAALRSNHPIPPRCGLYYYEVEIVSKGKEGYIGVGISAGRVSLSRLPGWEKDSWGYHGDDGNSFSCSGSGKAYGPLFTTGDVVGCCLSYCDGGYIFFTKNGHALGVAFRDMFATLGDAASELYPCVGFRTPNEQVTVNFGQKPFVFDIHGHVKSERRRLRHAYQNHPVTSLVAGHAALLDTGLPLDVVGSDGMLPQVMVNMVLAYLIHHAHAETAKILASNTHPHVPWEAVVQFYGAQPVHVPEGQNDVTLRRQIMQHTREGRIEQAMEMTQHHYPGVLEDNTADLHFRLQCQRFLELVRHCEGVLDADSDSDSDHEMDHDALPTNGHGKTIRFSDVFSYGQMLQAMYAHDTRSTVRKQLEETFSVLAYPDPLNSAVSGVLDEQRRIPLATDLNVAILHSAGKSLMDPITNVQSQLAALERTIPPQTLGEVAFLKHV